jgi:glycosyltransferase involved in cell wall biosynthesis
MNKLSIIIPVFNEEKTILKLLDKVIKANTGQISKEIVIVNDCSTDNSSELIQEYILANPNNNFIYEENKFNKGKGYSLNKGILISTGDLILFQDADLEYDPNEYSDLLKPILEGYADVVYGSRFQGSKPHRILFFWHTLGNKFLTFISNALTNLNLTDMETCYKLFKRQVIEQIQIRENRFGIEPEITAKISKIPNIKIYEVGISYYGRTYNEGKKIGWKDGFRAIYSIIKYNL